MQPHLVRADAETVPTDFFKAGVELQGKNAVRLPESSDPDLLRRLITAFPTTGLWPVRGVVEDDLGEPWARYPREPYEGEAPDDIRGLFGLDRNDDWSIQEDDFCFECGVVQDRTGELLIESDRSDFEILDELLAPAHERQSYGGDLRPMKGQITMVSTTRPSDAIAELGWQGAMNAGWASGDAVHVLRSWEERFGAYVTSVSRSTLGLIVARPPQSREQAQLLARELLHFCRYDTQFHGFGGIGPYVDSLIGSHHWSFWWD